MTPFMQHRVTALPKTGVPAGTGFLFRKPASPQMKLIVELLRLFGVLNLITGVCILVITAESLSGGSFLIVGLLMPFRGS